MTVTKKKEKSKGKVADNGNRTEKRILVISSLIGKLASVKTITWSEELPNIADFDVVIMDLVSLYSDVKNNKIGLSNLSYPNKEAVSNLLLSGGELIVISYPVTHLTQELHRRHNAGESSFDAMEIPGKPPMSGDAHSAQSVYPRDNLYWWSPIPIKNHLESSSSSIIIEDTRFREYIEQGIKNWSYYLELDKWQDEIPLHSEDVGRLLWKYNIEPIASNRYGKPIAASFSITAKIKNLFEKEVRVIPTLGTVTILPPPTKLTIEEAIRLILAKLYGVALESVEPEWLQNYKVPGEDDLEVEIRSSEQRIEEKKKKVEQKIKQLKDLTKFKKLLTEANYALEEIVWETLEELGATVKRPDEPNKEDGWFTDYKGRKAVLEIKGKNGRKSIATMDVRELGNWVLNGLAKGEDYKGILFGNPFREESPEKRREPFPPDVREFAEKSHQCVVTTAQFFEAFKRVKAGKMKAEVIFDKLMETNGVCELITD